MNDIDVLNHPDAIAIIGLSGRFPRARNVAEFWKNLRDGVEGISFFSDEELEASGVNSAERSDPNYVKAKGILDDIELFDASFFGINPREAELIDPQHRIFLECAWEALENAGYDPEAYEDSIGVYAGASMNTYYDNNLVGNPVLLDAVGDYQTTIANNIEFLPTRVSYKLDLRGPSVNIQTACSTSLVAVQFACQGLLDDQCDIALAGAISIILPHKAGYLYQEGMIASPDGHCRTFDVRAQGTVGGEGVGIVVLKRLADALEDKDQIHAVIRGSAINNDGALKVGFTAPSVDGQSEAIAMAQAIAEVEPETIAYIEAHGTATTLGDPIEIAALTEVFRESTKKKGFCAIGSVKTNIGHLDAAAGVAGLIKTVLALRYKQIPPSLHFTKPNPKIDFANSPFYVNAELAEWQTNGFPRRAGVSSFGIGGTNAHVVLEEAPLVAEPAPSRPWQLLLLSANTATALETATENLATHFNQEPELNLADAAYTLQVGRRPFTQRRMVVCHDLEDAASVLETKDPKRLFSSTQEVDNRPVVFMFTGQGAQYVNMALELYQVEPTFREHVDFCAEFLKPHLGLDLRHILYPGEADIEEAGQRLRQTHITQPALFVIEYALARLWLEWGLQPQAMIGHSIGEYVAACLAGVFSLEEALILVTNRGRLMQSLPAGAMLSVSLPEAEVRPMLDEHLSLAAVNGTSLCVVSGPTEAVDELENTLIEQGVQCRRLHTSHAFHSEMMDPILEPFAEQVARIALNPPQIPFVSNVTGTWITADEATDPAYWARHIRQTVRFAQGVETLLQEPTKALLEVGPGQTLSSLVRQHPAKPANLIVSNSIRHPQDSQSDVAFLLNTLGRLWLAGVEVDWTGFYGQEQRYRISLPTYPFERQHYWVEPQTQKTAARTVVSTQHKNPDISDWFYIPSWKRAPLPKLETVPESSQWLLFMDEFGLGKKLAKRLERNGQDVTQVIVGEQFNQVSERVYTINPQADEDYFALLEELQTLDRVPNIIMHLWSVTPNECASSGFEYLQKAQNLGFYSLLFLTQALGKQLVTDPVQIKAISNNIQEVVGDEELCPPKATILGACRVIPQEYPNISCRNIDIVLPESEDGLAEKLIDQLIAETSPESSDTTVAYRGKYRWAQTFEARQLNGSEEAPPLLREGGVYLITGGLGDIGLLLAQYLAQTVQAKLVLTGRSLFPAKDEWRLWLETHDEQDSVSYKIQQVQALEELGAEVFVFSADVADEEQMEAVITQTYERFGQLNGVIHAAGIISEETFRSIQEITRVECEQQFGPKVRGLLVLERILQGRALDFCLLTSSLSSILGGLRYVAYSAANLYLDITANRQNQIDKTPWLTVNWDGWQFVEVPEQDAVSNSDPAALAMTPIEGVETSKRILSNTSKQIVVSVSDLQARIDQWVDLKPIQQIETNDNGVVASLHARPDMANAYVAPRSEYEQRVVNIWQDLLGIDQIGIHDDFFELGGHSLLATQVTSRVRQDLGVEVSLRSLFEAPTTAELALVIAQKKVEQADNEKLAQLLADIENLSADDVETMLKVDS